jgi:hypothetical protein
MRNILVAEIGLQRAGVDAVVRQFVTTGVPQHVRVHTERESGRFPRALDQLGETGRCERRSALRQTGDIESGRGRAAQIVEMQVGVGHVVKRSINSGRVLWAGGRSGRGLSSMLCT